MAAFLIVAISLVSVSSESEKEETQNPLERFLHGSTIGASFDDFVRTHPEAVYSDPELRNTPVKAEVPGALLIEHESDPFLGLHGFANFGFKEGSLYELVAVWSGNPKVVEAHRKRFFKAIIQRHGHVYARETILVFPNSAEERPVPVLLWQEPTLAALAFYTMPSPLDLEPKASLTYAQFAPGDPFLTDILSRSTPNEEQQRQAWKSLEEVIALLEQE